jgi:Na+/proline symporter/signal transduction histidine kinase
MADFKFIGFFLLAYFAFLFVLAYFFDKNSVMAKKMISRPWVYSLSLAVYCTSWTYYGSVGSAAKSGLIFMTIYLGPMISVTLWWFVLRKMIRIKERFKITTIVDFISARYDKSEGIGMLASVLVAIGTIPYIALQLKSILKTTEIISTGGIPSVQNSINTGLLGAVVVSLLIIMTIFFGLRKIDSSERHPGLILILVIECIIKLFAFLCVGIFVTYFLHDGFDSLLDKIPSVMGENYVFMGIRDLNDFITWGTYLILSGSAILLLPRQFHVAVIENTNEEHVRTAKWMFPLYLLLINIFVLPIAIAGRSAGYGLENADTFVLLLPLKNNQQLLSLLTFTGGFSAAIGMIMIATVSVSTIISNHLILPVINSIKGLRFLNRSILYIRWITAASLIIISYIYMSIVGGKYALVAMGMVSFAAALQFLPVIVAAMYWKRASRVGAYMALIGGMFVWGYTLIIPAIIKSGWWESDILIHGLFGVGFLRPEALFGFKGYHHLSNAVLWSMSFNVLGLVMGSLIFRQSESEKRLAEDYWDAIPIEGTGDTLLDGVEDTVLLKPKNEKFQKVLNSFFDSNKCNQILEDLMKKQNIVGQEKVSLLVLSSYYEDVERSLAGVIGSATAHKVLTEENIISELEKEELSVLYGKMMANLMINPRELNKKILLYQEKEKLMKKETLLLEKTLEKKESELEDQKLKAFHASKMAALGQMASGVAHEINNPLAIIATEVEVADRLIQKGKSTDEYMSGVLDRVRITLDRVAKIVRGLKTISMDSSEVIKTPVVFDELFLDVLGICSERFKASGIDIIYNENDELYKQTIQCDRVQISQCLLGLMSNSYDAIIDLDEKWIKVKLIKSDDFFIIHIIDSGHGISQEVYDKMFQPFFTTKDIGQGTGLGLSTGRTILEMHDGSLEADMTDSNTHFILKLPI